MSLCNLNINYVKYYSRVLLNFPIIIERIIQNYSLIVILKINNLFYELSSWTNNWTSFKNLFNYPIKYWDIDLLYLYLNWVCIHENTKCSGILYFILFSKDIFKTGFTNNIPMLSMQFFITHFWWSSTVHYN